MSQRTERLKGLFILALEASVYVDAENSGLTPVELEEVGKQWGLQPGEINDGLGAIPTEFGADRFKLFDLNHYSGLQNFDWELVPDYRDVRAFEFVHRELRNVIASIGERSAAIDRSVLLTRAQQANIDRNNVAVALRFLQFSEVIDIGDDGLVRYRPGRHEGDLPSERLAKIAAMKRYPGGNVSLKRPDLAKMLPIVRDVMSRRVDGRHPNTDALAAFAKKLDDLGYGRFRLWWDQLVAELERTHVATNPAGAIVLAAAIAEGALLFVVSRAQKTGLMTKIDLSKPQSVRFPELARATKTGTAGVDAIFTQDVLTDCEALNRNRQRIHAGSLLLEHPTGDIPDLRPEEAQRAIQTVRVAVRQILDWLEKHY